VLHPVVRTGVSIHFQALASIIVYVISGIARPVNQVRDMNTPLGNGKEEL